MASTSIGPNYVLDKTFTLASGNTVTGYQVVQGSAAGTCQVSVTGTSPLLGVAQLDPNEGVTLSAGDVVRVRMLGISKVQSAAAVTIYTNVRPVGQGLVDDAAAGPGEYYLGQALSAATQLFDIIEVDLTNKNVRNQV